MMGRQLLLALGLGLLCACGGSLDTQEDVAEAMVDNMEKLATILEGIDSQEAADDAAGDLEELAESMVEIAEARKRLGEPDQETDKELEAKYKDRILKVTQRIGQAGQTAGPYIAQSKKCQEAFERVGKKMNDIQ